MKIRWIEPNWELAWIIPLSAIFLWMLIIKLLGRMNPDFRRWGFPAWMPYIVAIFEGVGVCYLWQEDFQTLAAMCLAVVPFGAIITMTRYYEPARRYWLPGGSLLGLLLAILV